ncbi:MAG: carbohydrate kinase family protein [Cyanobacteriota bacterium]
MKVLCLGSICLDILIKNIEDFPRPNHVTQVDSISLLGGGGALNTAIALKRLGVDAYPMGEIGKDYAGDVLLNIMDAEGLDSSYVLRRENKCSSVVNVLINKEGERSFICNPGNFIMVSIDDYDWSILQEFDALLIGSCFLLDTLLPDLPEVLKQCKKYNTISLVDTVWPTRPTYKLIEKSIPFMDFFTPSFEEAQVISNYQKPEDIANWCLGLGAENVIIKMDKAGCYLANKNTQEQISALEVSLVDSTGAGDCFLAGFLKGLSLKFDLNKAAKLGNAAGAMCVQHVGAYTGIKDFDNLYKQLFYKYETNCNHV